jgi:hypothetical protein
VKKKDVLDAILRHEKRGDQRFHLFIGIVGVSLLIAVVGLPVIHFLNKNIGVVIVVGIILLFVAASSLIVAVSISFCNLGCGVLFAKVTVSTVKDIAKSFDGLADSIQCKWMYKPLLKTIGGMAGKSTDALKGIRNVGK